MAALVVVYGYSFFRCLGLTLGLFCNGFLMVRISPISLACFSFATLRFRNFVSSVSDNFNS